MNTHRVLLLGMSMENMSRPWMVHAGVRHPSISRRVLACSSPLRAELDMTGWKSLPHLSDWDTDPDLRKFSNDAWNRAKIGS